MEGRTPNESLFSATVRNVFETMLAGRQYALARAYGEMVDVLWGAGNSDGAVRVEELWNQLAAKYSFALFCGYLKQSLMRHENADAMERMTREHTAVISSSVKAV